ncbi:hypothetical protein QYM36_010846 [Artemia franciscana]|uniref:Uncharacterized protein n=1 Tax=Artemia franciscana TaxID=6661 RepID=A0AA88L4I6_ARTSF|nr:hypothetical protein QYM36_010846 [Artemia franciscana]
MQEMGLYTSGAILSKLAECEIQGSSRNKYTQGFRKFVDFITTRGKEGPKNLDIACVNSVVKALGHLEKRQCSIVTAEKRCKEHQWAFNPQTFNSEDYRKLKDGVADCMVPGLWRLSRNKLLNEDLPNLTAYVCFQVSFMFGHQLGVPENMTVQKFMNQHLVEEDGMYVILVEKHKTASIKSTDVAISLEEETIFRPYMKLARPALLKSGSRVPQNFLLSQKGEKLPRRVKDFPGLLVNRSAGSAQAWCAGPAKRLVINEGRKVGERIQNYAEVSGEDFSGRHEAGG